MDIAVSKRGKIRRIAPHGPSTTRFQEKSRGWHTVWIEESEEEEGRMEFVAPRRFPWEGRVSSKEIPLIIIINDYD